MSWFKNIDIASELAFRDKQIAERDETIRKLRDPVAVHIAMLRGEIAVPPLAELLHVYGATFSDLDAANIELAKARAEAAKWERLHDELYAEIASEHRRDEYGETETAAECVRRVLREHDELRARLAEYEEEDDDNCPDCGYIGKGEDFAYHDCRFVLRQRIAALEAEKAEREAQEPVAWAWDDAAGHMQVRNNPARPEWIADEIADDLKLRPLYAHPCDQWEGEMNWQPIETAPKDGTNVLLYREAGNMFIVGYFDNAHGWVDGECIAPVAGPDYWCKLEPPK